MHKIYFLGGLGSTVMYTSDLKNQMTSYRIHYIDLPGHGLNYDVEITDLNDLTNWFVNEINTEDSEEVTVIGHSLGADLLVYLSSQIDNIKNVILLDGGLLNLSEMGYDIDTEILETKSFIKNFSFNNLDNYINQEKADYNRWTENIKKATVSKVIYDLDKKMYKLNLHVENALNLLKIRREISFPLFNNLKDKNVLVLIPEDQPELILEEKMKILKNDINYKIIKNSGHDLYNDNPKEVGKQIIEFIT